MTFKLALAGAAAFAAFLVQVPAMAQSGKLVLYTSQPNEDAQATVDAFEATHPGIDVEWVREGTTKVMAKLQAEFAAGSPQPDLLLIADSVTMEGLKRDGRLMPYEGADVPCPCPGARQHDSPEGRRRSARGTTAARAE